MVAGRCAPERLSTPTGVGGVALGARRWSGGDGRPVLLVPGLSSNARLWDQVAARLCASGHPVLAVDPRGHGTSASVPDPPGSDPTLVAAADLAGVCAGLGWPRVLLAGQSWGGNVALQLAAEHPDLVAGLALVDGGWLHLGDRWDGLDTAWRALAPPELTGRRTAELRAMLAGAHPDWSPAAIEATLANLEQRPDGTVRPWLSRERHRARVASLLRHRPRELYPALRCRVVLLAAGDPPDPLALEAAGTLADAELVAFPGGDHDLHAQHPDRVADAIGALARAGGTAGRYSAGGSGLVSGAGEPTPRSRTTPESRSMSQGSRSR